jgi:hypothetical protein
MKRAIELPNRCMSETLQLEREIVERYLRSAFTDTLRVLDLRQEMAQATTKDK